MGSSFGRKGMGSVVVVGIDLSEVESFVHVLSPDGSIADSFKFEMGERGFGLFAEKVPKDARIAFEASGSAYPTWRLLKEMGYGDVTVAHPKELAWIVKSRRKSDKVDSLKIARLHLVGMLPECHLLERDEQIARDLLIQRVKLGVEIGRLKNGIVSYLKREGVYNCLPAGSDNFTPKRRGAILSLRFDDDRDLVMKTMMDRLTFLEEQCAPLEERIRMIASGSGDVKLLMSIPGVDFYLASLISSFIGDVERFPSDDHLASFLGIVPESWDSAKVRRRGRMTKDGPSVARWALSVMVDTVMRHNGVMRRYYLSSRERTGSGRLAHVASMRKLARMLYHMLKERESWRWEDPDLTERKVSRMKRGGDRRI